MPIKVFASNSVRGAVEALLPGFERSGGSHIDIVFEPAKDLFGSQAYFDADCVTRSESYPVRDTESLRVTERHRDTVRRAKVVP